MSRKESHGTYTGWRWNKCICTLCTQAKLASLRGQQAQVQPRRAVSKDTFSPEWRNDSLCRRFGPLDWKYEDGKTRHMTAEEWGAYVDRVFFVGRGGSLEEARSICERCPVKDKCLEAGLTDMPIFNTPPMGIWGGKSHRERLKMIGWARP